MKKQFTVYINWKNPERTEAHEVVLKDGGQPIAEITSYEDAWRLRDILNQMHNQNKRLREDNDWLRNKNQRLHKDADKLWDLCREHMTNEEILKELYR